MKRRAGKIVALLCAAVMLAPGKAFAAEDCARCKALHEAGFPLDYCEKLCTLQSLHPDWHFEKLDITGLSRLDGAEYTWQLCLHEESSIGEDRALVSPSQSLEAYRAADTAPTKDSGYYPASAEAVAYFLDPRNFLNETDLFQFLDLSDPGDYTEEQIEAVLKDSFCAGLRGDEGESCAVLLKQIAAEKEINALHLAARLRQEQGAEGNALGLGSAGNTLWRWYRNQTAKEGEKVILPPKKGFSRAEAEGLDGCYNPFNIGAGGTGYFQVIRAGAQRAKDEGWSSAEAGIRGGAAYLAEKYIGCYQNTLYLQKWNLDARAKTETGESKNFWSQYMQNVGGAFSEAVKIHAAIVEAGLLNEDFSFLIPVFEGMPAEIAADPAGGTCEVYRAASLPLAHVAIALPVSGNPPDGESLQAQAALPDAAAPAPRSTRNPWLCALAALGVLVAGGGGIFLLSLAIVKFPVLSKKESEGHGGIHFRRNDRGT